MNRRTLIRSIIATGAMGAAVPGSLAAHTPIASPASFTGMRRFDAPGTPLTLSPDGTMIAGIAEDGALCVWDTGSFGVVAQADERSDIPITQRSLAWAPDSSAVAYSLDAAIQMKDSDIYVFSVDTGTVTNLTDDDPDNTGADEISLSDPQGANVPIDLFPAWSQDSQQLIFTRTTWGQDPSITSLMAIPREGGEPEERYTLEPEGPMLVYSPMRWLDDGTVLFSIWMPQIDNPANGLWRLSPEGEATQLISGHPENGIPGVGIVDISPDSTRASVYSYIGMQQSTSGADRIWFEANLEDGGFSPWVEVVGLDTDPVDARAIDGPGLLIAAPIFTRDGGVIFMTRDRGQTMHLSRWEPGDDTTHILDIEEGDGNAMPGNWLGERLQLADDGTLLVLSRNGVVVASLSGPGNASGG